MPGAFVMPSVLLYVFTNNPKAVARDLIIMRPLHGCLSTRCATVMFLFYASHHIHNTANSAIL